MGALQQFILRFHKTLINALQQKFFPKVFILLTQTWIVCSDLTSTANTLVVDLSDAVIKLKITGTHPFLQIVQVYIFIVPATPSVLQVLKQVFPTLMMQFRFIIISMVSAQLNMDSTRTIKYIQQSIKQDILDGK